MGFVSDGVGFKGSSWGFGGGLLDERWRLFSGGSEEIILFGMVLYKGQDLKTA